MIKAPNVYSPARNPEKAKQRRDLVLRLMREEGRIDEAALQQALAEPVSARSRRPERTIAPHFVDFVKSELAERYGQKLKTEGLQIYTTLDVDLQQAGQRAVAEGLTTLEKNYRRLAAAAKEGPLQGALIGLEPETGAVRAFVGGRDYRLSQFNRVTQAHRQPGSLFKPFVFLAAFSAARPAGADHAGNDPARLADHGGLGRARRGSGLDAAQLRRRFPRADVGAAGRRAVDQHPDRPDGAGRGPADGRRRGARGGDRLAPARLSLGRPGRLRDLAARDRGRLRRARQRRRARAAFRHRGRPDGRRRRARPQGDADGAGPAGRRGLPRGLAAAGGRRPGHGRRRARGRNPRRPRGQDRNDQRRARRLVRRLLAAVPRRDLGRLRRQPRRAPFRLAGRGSDLRRLLEGSAAAILRGGISRCPPTS